MKLRISVIIALVLILSLSGCNSNVKKGSPLLETPSLQFTIAGSGSSLPLTDQLIAVYGQQGGEKIELPKSIGSGGAIKAVKSGALELGLTSRPLSADEEDGLIQVAYARIPIVIGSNLSVSEAGISYTELVDIFAGKKTTWENGKTIIVLSREEGDSTNEVLKRELPGFKEVLAESLKKARWQICYTDAEEAEAVEHTPNSIGFTDMVTLRTQNLHIKPLKVNGVLPSAQNVVAGNCKLFKDLYFVYKEPLSERAHKFLSFVLSEEGNKVMNEYDAIPLRK